VPLLQLGHVLALHIDRAKRANDVLDAGLDAQALFGLKEPPSKSSEVGWTPMLGDIPGGIGTLCHRRVRLNAVPRPFRHLKSPVSLQSVEAH
jgi:hypothetical protein|tara:strand:- start:634 stop:909 length:276 start_codon:yes stop_codon:yes gene_type:complete